MSLQHLVTLDTTMTSQEKQTLIIALSSLFATEVMFATWIIKVALDIP